MNDLAQAAGLPIIKTIAGKEVKVYPLRFCEWGLVERWMRKEVVEAAKSVISDPDLSQSDAQIIMREAMRIAQEVSLMSSTSRDGILQSLGCMAYIVQLSLQRDEKPMTVDQIQDLIGNNAKMLTELVETVFDLSFPTGKGGGGQKAPANPPSG